MHEEKCCYYGLISQGDESKNGHSPLIEFRGLVTAIRVGAHENRTLL
jgi:hypothetical protein